MSNDIQVISEKYEQILNETAETINVRRIDNRTIEVNGETKDISNWLAELSEVSSKGGGTKIITVYGVRRRDKKEGGVIVAKAGDPVVFNGRYGACPSEIKGVGSPLGPPKERYPKYDLVPMCVERDGAFHTRYVAVDSIEKVVADNIAYIIS